MQRLCERCRRRAQNLGERVLGTIGRLWKAHHGSGRLGSLGRSVRTPVVRREALVTLAGTLSWLGAARAQAQSARDANGPMVVTHREEDTRRIHVREKPKLILPGTTDGLPEFLNIVKTIRLGNGDIVVADATTRKLHVFDARGRFKFHVGGSGGGPGEFASLDDVFARGDTMLAVDGRLAVRLFDASGHFVRSMTFPALRDSIANPAIGALGVDAVLFRVRELRPEPVRGVFFIDSLALVRVDRSGTRRTLGTYPVVRRYASPGMREEYEVGFSARQSLAVFPDAYCVGYSLVYEFQCADTTGRVRLIVRRLQGKKVVTKSEREHYLDAIRSVGARMKGAVGANFRMHRELIARATVFEVFHPAYGRFVPSQSGEIWVKEYDPEDRFSLDGRESSPNGSRWSVYGRDGNYLGTALLPKRFVLHDVGDGYVLGVSRDDDDVESVVLLEIGLPQTRQ